MKIVMITGTYLPSANGVAIAVSQLKKSLEEKGHSVYLFAPDNKDQPKKREKNVFRYPSIENPLHKDYPIPLLPINGFLIKKLPKIKPDIIHVHHAYYIGYFAKLLAGYFKVPLVFTYHTNYDVYAQKYVGFLPPPLRDKFLNNRVYDFCKKADLVISPAEHTTKKLVKKAGLFNIATIPSPVVIENHNLDKKLLRKNKGIVDRKILLTVSRLSKEKNVGLVIKALKYLPDEYILFLIGTGPEEKDLRKLSVNLNLHNRVKFMGRIDHKMVPRYYAMADVFVFASDSETQGLVFLEAIKFNLPVVATNSGAANTYLSKFNGIISNKTPESLSKAIVKSLKLNPRLKALTNKKVLKEFDPKSLTKKLENEYQKIIKSKKIADKLLQSGWQSWSTGKIRHPLSLIRDFNPLNEDYTSLDLVNYKNNKLKPPVTGWCSWYAFGRNISHKKIVTQAEQLRSNKINIDYILIDEGWCKWGDWMEASKNKFPAGLKTTIREVGLLGFSTGIWLAPFLVEKSSVIFKDHPEWLVYKDGKPVNGINWTKLDDLYLQRFILDIRKKEVFNYLCKCIDNIAEWGIGLIKLDFLYAAYFIPGISAYEASTAIKDIFGYIKKKYPHIYTIACGAPLVPVAGLADSVRIGPDTVSPLLNIPFIKDIFHNYRVGRVINNIKKRKWTSKYWNIDPDVFVCRKNLGINNDNIEKLFYTIKNCGGNIFLGDDVASLSPELIKKYILPLTNK
jgi:1,2-diacylglycerol 3-alpha-glucosyltransferase